MTTRSIGRRWPLAAVVLLSAAAAGVVVVPRYAGGDRDGDRDARLPRAAQEMYAGESEAKEAEHGRLATQGTAGDESAEARVAAEQFGQARTAPGVVAPGAYSAAFGQLSALPATKSTWTEVTTKPYDSDDPRYRDPVSNATGGSGVVTGRITGVAVGADGTVYAGGANGGVFRRAAGASTWTAIADRLPSLSVGDLELGPDGALWLATGEANTGGTAYVGTGVYRLAAPRTGLFSPADRVGGAELESTVINKLRFDDAGTAWAATSRGLWRHAASGGSAAWTFAYAPNPTYLPGGADAGAADAPYKNLAQDLAVQPGTGGPAVDRRHRLAQRGHLQRLLPQSTTTDAPG